MLITYHFLYSLQTVAHASVQNFTVDLHDETAEQLTVKRICDIDLAAALFFKCRLQPLLFLIRQRDCTCDCRIQNTLGCQKQLFVFLDRLGKWAILPFSHISKRKESTCSGTRAPNAARMAESRSSMEMAGEARNVRYSGSAENACPISLSALPYALCLPSSHASMNKAAAYSIARLVMIATYILDKGIDQRAVILCIDLTRKQLFAQRSGDLYDLALHAVLGLFALKLCLLLC